MPRPSSRAALALAVLLVGCAELAQLGIPIPPVVVPPGAPTPTPPSGPNPNACLLDANCAEFQEWADDARSVVDVRGSNDPEVPGCTGVLLNNARGDGTPYVLLAHHCAGKRQPGERLYWWKFYFRRTSDRCNAASSPRVPACTVENRCLIGATVVAAGPSGTSGIAGGRERDFMLLRLNRPVPSSFGARHAGWSIEATAPRSAAVLGHPQGHPLSITLDHDPVDTQGSCTGAGSMLTLQVDRGQLVRGQSGAPVFDENHRVRGVVLTGTGCTYPSRSCAASLAYNWTYGSAGNRLLDHLAGGNAGLRRLGAR